jgi:predicted GNAT family N-acyltransferase
VRVSEASKPDDVVVLFVPVFSPLCNLAFALRREVFVIEQRIAEAEEFDAHDLTARHLVAVKAGGVVGTLRLIAEAEAVRIGRVAVAQAMRGQGIALRMMRHAMQHEAAVGRTRFHLHAQIDKVGFYQRLGFVVEGEPFDDGSGIMHLAMHSTSAVRA